MATIEKRVAVLEGGRNGPFSNLTDIELDKEIQRLCIAAGTTIEEEIERYGSCPAFLTALSKEIAEGSRSRLVVGKHGGATIQERRA